jgi:hypothetical protein
MYIHELYLGNTSFPNWFGPAAGNPGSDLQSVMTPCLLPAEYRAAGPAEVLRLCTLDIVDIPGRKKILITRCGLAARFLGIFFKGSVDP